MRGREQGFTLMELLVTLSIVGILAALAVQNFRAYRALAYDSVMQSTIRDAQTALEAGKNDIELSNATGVYSAWKATAGEVAGWRTPNHVPGLVNPDNHTIFVFYNSDCASLGDWCLVDFISATHCKGSTQRWWYRYRNGTTYSIEVASAPTC